MTKDDEIDERDTVELTDDVWECLISFIDYVTVGGRTISSEPVVKEKSEADRRREILDNLNAKLSAARNAESAPQATASSSQSKLPLAHSMGN